MAPKQASTSQAKKRKRNDESEAGPSVPRRKRTPSKSARPTANKQEPEEEGPDDNETLREGQSVREAAREYLLGVAKMPLSVMSTKWSNGQNRLINTDHVNELKASYAKIGVERTAEEHRLRVLCSRAAFDKISEIERNNPSSTGEPSFLNWGRVNKVKVEVMAGQHRIQALRLHAQEVGSDTPDQLWWMCELYDKGTLPVWCYM